MATREILLLSVIGVLLIVCLCIWVQNRILKKKLHMYRQEYRAMFGTYNI